MFQVSDLELDSDYRNRVNDETKLSNVCKTKKFLSPLDLKCKYRNIYT